jgi:hypoxanthine phosphoribosyltransferase
MAGRRPTLQTGDILQLGDRRGHVLFSPETIQTRVGEIGLALRHRHGDRCPVFVGMLHGGFIFLSDLIRSFGAPHEIDFLKMSRYDPGRKDQTEVKVLQDLRSPVRGRVVVVVEAIRARGTKVEYLERFLRLHGPEQVEFCALVLPEDGNLSVPVQEVGFRIGREFVVGYGLDWQERFRGLPGICVLDPDPGAAGPDRRGEA